MYLYFSLIYIFLNFKSFPKAGKLWRLKSGKKKVPFVLRDGGKLLSFNGKKGREERKKKKKLRNKIK